MHTNTLQHWAWREIPEAELNFNKLHIQKHKETFCILSIIVHAMSFNYFTFEGEELLQLFYNVYYNYDKWEF